MKLKKSILPLLMVFALPTWAANSTDGKEVKIPSHWHILPEDRADVAQPMRNFWEDEEEVKDDTEKVEKLVSRIYKAHGEAIEKSNLSLANIEEDSDKKPKDWVPWRMVVMRAGLGVSLSGTIGVLAFKGNPSAVVVWGKRDKSPAAEPAAAEAAEDGAVLMNAEWSEERLMKEVEPTIQAVIASGRVENETLFRKSFKQTVRDLHGLVQSVPMSDHGVWVPSKFRFDLGIEASGSVSFIASLGGALQVRLEWLRPKGQTRPPDPAPMVTMSNAVQPMSKGLGELVRVLSSDLQAMSEAESANSQFKAKSLRIGIGFSAKGDIGVVKAGIKTVGHIYFDRQERPSPMAMAATGYAPGRLLMIEHNPPQRHLDFARSRGFNVLSHSVTAGGAEAVYDVNRDNFRKGLAKAIEMSKIFTKPGEEAEAKDKEWAVQAVKVGFGMSVGGDIGVVNVGSTISATVKFVNTKF
ncbi:MAG: hypothetical protein H6624_01940 [Bdellovibrionaceae bacterium]|nr:hypothetical protein [Bdellovibrionales bacterium]MCB9083070.1 hypothetical protein [Pseudobdellovibrionaceae bacterium]